MLSLSIGCFIARLVSCVQRRRMGRWTSWRRNVQGSDSVCLEGMKKTTETFSYDIWYLDQDSKRTPLEYMSVALQQHQSALKLNVKFLGEIGYILLTWQSLRYRTSQRTNRRSGKEIWRFLNAYQLKTAGFLAGSYVNRWVFDIGCLQPFCACQALWSVSYLRALHRTWPCNFPVTRRSMCFLGIAGLSEQLVTQHIRPGSSPDVAFLASVLYRLAQRDCSCHSGERLCLSLFRQLPRNWKETKVFSVLNPLSTITWGSGA
jgi:hypothetical protein